jgi:ABC-type transporter Mla subunit MlaD
MTIDWKEIGEAVAAVTVIAGIVAWTFREKLGTWVKRRTSARFDALEGRLTQLEDRMDHVERSGESIARAIDSAATAFREGTTRLTAQMEKIVASHEETSATVNYIRGVLDANGSTSPTAKRRKTD